MAYAGDQNLVRLAMALRKQAFEKAAHDIAARTFEDFQTKLAGEEPTFAVASKHPTLFLHLTRP